jgi:hypothetical protein
MSKTKTIRLLLVLGLFILGALVTVVPRTQVHALDLSSPGWWKDNTGAFSQCDKYQYNHGHTIDGTFYAGLGFDSSPLQYSGANAQWNGLVACGPRPEDTSITWPSGNSTHDAQVQFASGGNRVGEFQCTELVFRYLYMAYGAPMESSTDGSQVVTNYTNDYPSLFRKVTNDGNTHVKVGDVLSYSTVHTAIVINTDNMNANNGTGTITVLEQNADPSGEHTQTVTNWKIKNGVDNGSGNGDTVAAWLTPRGQFSVQTTVNPGSNSQFKAVSALSASNVWAVGYYNSAQNALIEHWDGTSWTQQSAANPGTTANVLYGVKALSATNIWAVGYYTDTNGTQVLIEHSTNGGSSWSQDTSYQGGYSLFAIDGNPSTGDAWAVGYVAGNNPLVLHLSSGSWSSVSTSADTVTQARLFGVSEDSSGNVWAVGDYNPSGEHTFSMYYNHSGNSWTNETSPTPGAYGAELTAVTNLGSSGAWAVGYESGNIGFLTHWDPSTSTWSSASILSLGTHSNLFGVAAADSNDIFAVGSYYDYGTYPLVWHTSDGGSTWAQLSTDGSLSSNGFGEFYGIAIEPTNYNTWTVGTGDGGSLAEFLN